MASYLYRMPAGVPGETNRSQTLTIVPASVTPFGTTGAPTAYGVPMVIDQTVSNVGNMRTVQAADTAAVIYGLLARPFPTQSFNYSDPLGNSSPPASGQIDIMRRGFMTVLLSGSTGCVKGGQVYVWTATASGSHIVGGYESTNPGGSGFALNNATFMGPADASGNVEIEFNI